MGAATAAFLYLLLGGLVWVVFRRARPSAGVETFVEWFDRVFRARRVEALGGLVLPSFLRSVLVSCASLLVLALLWVVNKDTLSRELRFGDARLLWGDQARALVLVYGGATVITNWIPDYLSLVQSRWVIGRIAKTRAPAGRIGWLAADALLTLGIAYGAIFAGGQLLLPFVADHLTIEVGCFTRETFTLGAAWEIFTAGLAFETPPATLNYDAAGIYVYSTFLTSIWLWLHLFASLAAQIAAVTFPRAKRPATSLVLGFGGLLAFSAGYWSLHFSRTPHHDVRVLYDRRDPQAVIGAERLIGALRDEGLDATAAGRRHSLAVIVESEHGDHLGGWLELERQIACGARAERSVRSVRPNDHRIERIIDWAKHAPSILSRDQLAECRRRFRLPPQPACDALESVPRVE